MDERLIHRWLTLPVYQQDLAASGLNRSPEVIAADTRRWLPETLKLADAVFSNWLSALDEPSQRVVLGSR